jgi:hypothetical protein
MIVWILFNQKLSQHWVASLVQMLMLACQVGLWEMTHLWLFKHWRFKSVCVEMVCGELKGAHHHWIFIALQFKETWWSIVTPKSSQEKQFAAYLIHVTMVCGLIWKGLHRSVTNFGCVHMIWLVVLEELEGNIMSIDHLSHQHDQCK